MPTPVPRNHGGRLNQNQGRAPVSPDLREREGPLPGLEPGPLLGSGVGCELLPKSEVLEGERATRREDRAEDPDQKAHEKAHGSAILPRPRVLTIPCAYEVFADHARRRSSFGNHDDVAGDGGPRGAGSLAERLAPGTAFRIRTGGSVGARLPLGAQGDETGVMPVSSLRFQAANSRQGRRLSRRAVVEKSFHQARIAVGTLRAP